MPSAAVGVECRIRGCRKRAMHVALLLGSRRMVDRGPYKRVPESDPRVHVQEALIYNRFCREIGDTDSRGRAPHKRGIARRIGRRDEQKATG